MFRSSLYTILCIILISSSSELLSQKYSFRYLSIDDGLSNYKVNSICKDSSGFIWFGTNEGLNRYDGYEFKVFKNLPDDPNSIGNNLVRKLIINRDKDIVVAHDYGVDIYDDDKESFQHLESGPGIAKEYLTWSICEDSHGTIWIGSVEGLLYKTPEMPYVQRFSDKHTWFEDQDVLEVFTTDNDQLFIGTKNNGVFVFNMKDESHYQLKKDNDPGLISICGNTIEALYQDSLKRIWIGTLDNGLDIFDPESGSVEHARFNADDRKVRDIEHDRFGRIWVATYSGLFLKEKDKDYLMHYAHTDDSYSVLINNSIYDLCIDNHSMIWLGTYSGGVNYCDIEQKSFVYYKPGQGNNLYLNDRTVYSIAKIDDVFWIGTERGGLNRYDRNQGTYRYYTMENSGISENNIKCILPDKKGNLWIGTYYGGLDYYNSSTGKFNVYRHSNNRNSIQSDVVYTLSYDADSNLYIGTITGIDYLNVKTKRFQKCHIEKEKGISFSNEVVHHLYCDSQNNIWMGIALDGLYKKTANDSVFRKYSNDLSGVAVFHIFEDHTGQIWLGTNDGIFLLDVKTGIIKQFTEQDGLKANLVNHICEDNSNNIWLTTPNGITKFENGVLNSEDRAFTNYTSDDGIFIKQFTNNTLITRDNNEMFFGGVDGFISFIPEEIKKNPYLPVIKITKFSIFNDEVNIGEESHGKVILEKSITKTDKVNLSYKDKVFTIEFAALHYAFPTSNQYKYMLEGFDNEWFTTTSDKRSATYTNISKGTYVFKVNATNNDGVWSDHPAELTIKVSPPFWQMQGVWIFTIITLLALIIIIVRWRTTFFMNQKKELELTVQERTTELQNANLRLEKQQERIMLQNEELSKHRDNLEELISERTKELEAAKQKAVESDRLKSAFLANMSHEIRTPLNAIIGFSRILATENNNFNKEDLVNIIEKSSDSLLVLINDILDISKIEANQLKIYKEPFNLITLFKEIESLYQVRQNENVDIIFDYQSDIKIYNDYTRVKQVILNFINNAIKFTDEGYIKVAYTIEDNFIDISVEDTGIGIPEDKIGRVFNYFEKIEDYRNKLYRGTGIGLSICSRLSELMGGKVWVVSRVDEGSVFHLELPLTGNVQSIISDTKPAGTISREKHSRFKVFIAEDEENNYLLLKYIIKNLNGEVIYWAKNGQEALDYMISNRNKQIDVVLMDIKMPEMNGIEAFKKLKAFNIDVPVVAVTAYASILDRTEIMKEGFTDYLSKPINLEEFKNVLHKLNLF